MVFIVKVIDGVKKIIPVTADVGAGNPVGSYLYLEKKSNPQGYLYCDGSTFDETKYPLLYAYLGSNVLPDWREFSAVGAEQNTTSSNIATHDVYTQGEEKDDQMQQHSHDFSYGTSAGSSAGMLSNYVATYGTGNVSRAYRTGTVTRGKRKAVFIYIKATSGLSENAQDNVINTLNEQRSYSTEEHLTGKKWIDGKPIYSKTIDFGALPNSTTKNVNHGITNLDKITSISGITTNGTNIFPLPHVNPPEPIFSIAVYATTTQVTVLTGTDRSGFTSTQVTLEYTKTT